MAREESSREDLLREAIALVERIELAPANGSDDVHVVVGFRADGALSIFFGEDPVYQFNAAGELRRAYYDGLLYKAARGRLASLDRVRREDAVQLMRHDLSDDEQSSFLSQMNERLDEFARRLEHGRLVTLGQVPPNTDVLTRVRAWFAARGATVIAQSPNVGERRGLSPPG